MKQHCVLILMSIVGLMLWGWVMTLSPSSSTTPADGGCPQAVNCCWKHCWLKNAHFVCLFCVYVYIFPEQPCLGIFMTIKHNIVFHFGKKIEPFFLSSGKRQNPHWWKLSLSCYFHNAVLEWRSFIAFLIFNTLFISSAVLWWWNYKVVENKEG